MAQRGTAVTHHRWRDKRHVHHEKAPVPPHGPERHGRDRGAAVARRDGAGRHGLRRRRRRPRRRRRVRLVAMEMVHGCGRQHGVRRQEEPVGAGEGRPRLRSVADQPEPLEPFRERRHHRQQHRRAQRRGVHAAGNRRRSLPLERGVPDAVAPEADRGQRRPRRHVARSALRAEVRPGHADSVDAAVDRERRPGRRLHLRLLLHLHRHDQLGVADAAAADGARPARRVRPAVRRRRDAGRARRQPPRRQEHSRLGHQPDLDAAEGDRLERSRSGSTNISTTSARSSGGFSASKRATAAAKRGRSPKRRSACPTRSKSTSTS